MKLTHKNNRIATPFGDIQFEVDNLFDHVFGDRTAQHGGWVPRAAVSESDTGYQLTLELPGVDPAGVNLEFQENRLVLSGEKSKVEIAEGSQSLRDERLSGEFKRVFEFKHQVDAERVTASFEQGVLSIQLPKSESVLPRKIEIQVG